MFISLVREVAAVLAAAGGAAGQMDQPELLRPMVTTQVCSFGIPTVGYRRRQSTYYGPSSA